MLSTPDYLGLSTDDLPELGWGELEPLPPPPPPAVEPAPVSAVPVLDEQPTIFIVHHNLNTFHPHTFGEWDGEVGYRWYSGGAGKAARLHGLQLPRAMVDFSPDGAPLSPRLRLESHDGSEAFGDSALELKATEVSTLWTLKFNRTTAKLVRLKSETNPPAFSDWFRICAKSPSGRKRERDNRNGAGPRGPVPPKRICTPPAAA